jgi:arylsulfatase A-like enzyme
MHYGLYPQKTGLFRNGVMMPDNGDSYPAVLGRAGYRTHAIGKCHFTPDAHASRGFQSRQTQEECTSDPTQDDYVAWLADNGHDYYEPHGARGEMYYIPQVSTLPAEAHPSQWVGNESVRFIGDMAATDQPWCLFSSFIHPHPPFAPPKPWHKLYRAPDMPLPYAPEHSAELHTWVNRLQNRYKHRDRGIDLNLLRTIEAYYYATISFMDYQIGRILKALEESGELDNTLILFTSDHGEHLGDLNCFGKRSMHDASARVPMILRFPPRFPAGHHCPVAVSLVDVFPTLLTACDIPTGEVELDGVDLATVVRGNPDGRAVYSQFEEEGKAIYMAVSEHWKYVYSAGDDLEFFFDRHRDPHEVNNLAGSTEAQSERESMKQELLRYLANVGMADAYDSIGGNTVWRKYPQVDESYLEDPDAGLLFQDYPIRPGVRRCAPGERYEAGIEGYAETRG